MNDGGTAFPVSGLLNSNGMSLRDVFAGMALQGLLSNSDATKGVDENQIAGAAYLHADAMIRCREDTT